MNRRQPSRCQPVRQIRGAFTALVTPFTADGAIDEAAFRGLVRRQIEACIDGLVPCGTTGESPTLTPEEREWVDRDDRRGRLRAAVAVPRHDRRRDRHATTPRPRSPRPAAPPSSGADAALVVAPYYNKPDQRMLEAHFRAVADEGDLPIIVYNVPGRTGVNVEAATLLRLAEHPRIVAVKEASANMDQIATILRDRPADFSVLAGDDAWTLPMLALGGDGVICTCVQRDPGRDGGHVRRRLRRRLGRARAGSTSAGCRS